MRTIAAVTGARSDYGLYRPLFRRIAAHPDLDLAVFVTGMHLSPDFGETVREVEADGFAVAERIEMLLASDSPQAIAKAMGVGTLGFAAAFARARPDLLVLLGDRFEMHAAGVAALPFRIPVAHLYGGELTRGAFDDALRHSLTKLSHLHFVAAEEYRRRVIQLGEEPWRVAVAGALSLDQLAELPRLGAAELAERHGLKVDRPPLLVTFHPVTLEADRTEWQADELLAALADAGLPIVFTMPNADTAGRIVRRKIAEFVARRPAAQAVESLGTQGYFSLMSLAAAMVGNSSSGLIEAPSFALPVVNVGTRHAGRLRAANVLDVSCEREAIAAGIAAAVDPAFRAGLRGLVSPFGTGRAAATIVERLATVDLDERLLVKRFHDLAPGETGGTARDR